MGLRGSLWGENHRHRLPGAGQETPQGEVMGSWCWNEQLIQLPGAKAQPFGQEVSPWALPKGHSWPLCGVPRAPPPICGLLAQAWPICRGLGHRGCFPGVPGLTPEGEETLRKGTSVPPPHIPLNYLQLLDSLLTSSRVLGSLWSEGSWRLPLSSGNSSLSGNATSQLGQAMRRWHIPPTRSTPPTLFSELSQNILNVGVLLLKVKVE